MKPVKIKPVENVVERMEGHANNILEHLWERDLTPPERRGAARILYGGTPFSSIVRNAYRNRKDEQPLAEKEPPQDKKTEIEDLRKKIIKENVFEISDVNVAEDDAVSVSLNHEREFGTMRITAYHDGPADFEVEAEHKIARALKDALAKEKIPVTEEIEGRTKTEFCLKLEDAKKQEFLKLFEKHLGRPVTSGSKPKSCEL